MITAVEEIKSLWLILIKQIKTMGSTNWPKFSEIIPTLEDCYEAIEGREDIVTTEMATRHKFFLAACLIILEGRGEVKWETLRTISKRNEYGGLIGCADSWLDPIFKPIKVLRLHAVLHDAGGYMKKTYGVNPGYTYASWACKPSGSPLRGQISGLLYCLGLKIYRNKQFKELQL